MHAAWTVRIAVATVTPLVRLSVFFFAILVVSIWPRYSCAAPIAIAVSRNPIGLPVFLAVDQGFFKDEGLDIKAIDCFPGKQCLKLLLEDKAQFATVASTPIVAASFTRSDFVILATISSSSNDSKLIVRKSAHITSAKDLIGKRIGVIKGTTAEFFLDSFLLFYGVDPAEVKLVDKLADALPASIKTGEVDAITAFEPSAYKAVTLLGDDAMVLPNPRIFTTAFNIVAQRRLVGTSDADITKILRAIARANQFIKSNPAEAKRLMQKNFNASEAFTSAIWPDIDYTMSLDQSFLKSLENEARWMAEKNSVVDQKPRNFLDIIYAKPLRQLFPKSVTLVN